jgi:hypothetical protein
MNFRKKYLFTAIFFIAVFFLWRFLRPINIFIVDEKFEKPIHVETPQGLSSLSAKECGKCHEEIYREWSGSMHAKAWVDPYFQVDYAYDGSRQICLNCHTPLENQQENLVLGFKDNDKFKPILKPNPNYDSNLRNEGVTCAVCHIKEGKIIGPFETDNAPHPVITDPEMSSGMKSCEKCHVVYGKRWDTFYWIPPCGTVAEVKKQGDEPDCIGCHMPEVIRPVAKGSRARKGGKHLFHGGHYPEMVRNALKVEYQKEANIGAVHYLPTGTPDRHLTLELRLIDKKGKVMKEEVFTMKRYILWRPFIVDLKDTRLPYGVSQIFFFKFSHDSNNTPSYLDVKVRYHLLDEKQRKKIGYVNKDPIAYPVYEEMIPFEALQLSLKTGGTE